MALPENDTPITPEEVEKWLPDSSYKRIAYSDAERLPSGVIRKHGAAITCVDRFNGGKEVDVKGIVGSTRMAFETFVRCLKRHNAEGLPFTFEAEKFLEQQSKE